MGLKDDFAMAVGKRSFPRAELKRIIGQVRRAIQEYEMISEGDRIAVGVSGGKDSLTLLIALRKLMDFYPVRFEIKAVTLDMGIGEPDYSPVRQLCEDIGVEYTIENTYIGRIVFEARQESSPCSLCANLRRGALNNAALRLGCNMAALAHNRDDVVETLLLSTFYEGRIHTFSPVTYLTGKDPRDPRHIRGRKADKNLHKAKQHAGCTQQLHCQRQNKAPIYKRSSCRSFAGQQRNQK